MDIQTPNLLETADAFGLGGKVMSSSLNRLVASVLLYYITVLAPNEPVLTGALKASNRYEMLPSLNNKVSGRVYVGIPLDQRPGVYYAIYVNDGTGIYAINQSLVSGRLKNGGIQPQQFMEKSLTQASAQIDELMRASVDVVFAGVTKS